MYSNYDYYTTYDYGSSSTGIGLLAGFGAFGWIISIGISALMIISMWKIFKKAGKNGWEAIIPIYNIWVFFEICDLSGWLCLIPFANIICLIMAYYRIALKFGKPSGFGVLTIFFAEICLPILAFSKATYGGNEQFYNAQPMPNNQVAMEQQNFENPAAPATKVCPKCGNVLAANLKFCDQCGRNSQLIPIANTMATSKGIINSIINSIINFNHNFSPFVN